MSNQIIEYRGKLYTYPDSWSRERIAADLDSKPVPIDYDKIEAKPPTSKLRAFGSGAMQGATLGFSDELAGMLGGDKEAWRASQQQHQDTYPGAYIGGNVAGGLASAGAAAAALPVAGATGGLGAGVTALRAAAPRLAALGAAEGAVAGAGYSNRDTPGAVAKDALIGGATGSVLGTVLPAGVWGASALARRSRPTNRAARTVNQGLQESGVTPAQAQAKVDANPAMVVADTSTQSQQQLGALSRRAGDTPTAVEGTIVPRNTSQVDRFETSFADALGGGTTVPEARAASQASRKAQAQIQYTAAYDVDIKLTDELDALLQRKPVRQAYNAAFDMVNQADDPQIASALNTFKQTMQTNVDGMTDEAQRAFAKARKSGNVVRMMKLSGVETVPTPVVDYMGRVMRMQSDAAFRGGRPEAHITNSIRRRVMNEVDAQNPKLAEARGTWAGGKADEDALDIGRKALTDTVPEFNARFGAMSASEQDHVRVGIFESIMDRMKSGSDDIGGDVRRLVNNRKAKDLLSMAFGDEDKYSDFLRMLDDETAMSATTRAVRSPQAQSAAGDAAGNLPLTGFLVKQAIAKLGARTPFVQQGFEKTRNLTGQHLLSRTVPTAPSRQPMSPWMRAMGFPAAMGFGPEQ